jgi:hypothetical protein
MRFVFSAVIAALVAVAAQPPPGGNLLPGGRGSPPPAPTGFPSLPGSGPTQPGQPSPPPPRLPQDGLGGQVLGMLNPPDGQQGPPPPGAFQNLTSLLDRAIHNATGMNGRPEPIDMLLRGMGAALLRNGTHFMERRFPNATAGFKPLPPSVFDRPGGNESEGMEMNVGDCRIRLPPMGPDDPNRPHMNNTDLMMNAINFDHNLFPERSRRPLNASVLSITVCDANGTEIPLHDLQRPIRFTLPLDRNYTDAELNNPNLVAACVYWDLQAGDWKEDGCKVDGIVSNLIQCSCTHLTDFSAILALPPPPPSPPGGNDGNGGPGGDEARLGDLANDLRDRLKQPRGGSQAPIDLHNITSFLDLAARNGGPGALDDMQLAAALILRNDTLGGRFEYRNNNASFQFNRLRPDGPQEENLDGTHVRLPPLPFDNTSLISIINHEKNPHDSPRPLGCKVVSITISDENGTEIEVRDLQHPISISIPLLTPDADFASKAPVCLYWNTQYSEWRSDGCMAVGGDATMVNCSCNHLTDFSAAYESSSSSSSSSTELGAPIGGAVGGLIALVLIITLVVIIVKKKKSAVKPLSSQPGQGNEHVAVAVRK